MSRSLSRRVIWASVFALGATLALAAALGGFAGAGSAAATAKPHNTTRPSITGIPREGRRLVGHPGVWTGNPTSFAFFWLRCKSGSCPRIPGATAQTYDLTSADVGSRIRLQVRASNRDGSRLAVSMPTAVVTAKPPTPPPSTNGCPAGSGPDQVADVSLPAHLLIDGQQSSPSVVTRGTTQLTVRIHVSDTCGHSVQGALVYVTAVPFNQFSISPEQTTGADGWANLNMSVLGGFPASRHQQLLALFVRARKPGENLNAGIIARRLVSIPVRLG
jgi:hypothetical protein